MKLAKHYEDLHNIYGVSSNEKRVKEYILNLVQKIEGFYDKYSIVRDNLGGFGFYKKGLIGQRTIVFGAHMDEVGFLVSKINSNGTLELIKLGGLNDETIVSAEVTLINSKGEEFCGVIASIPPHLKDLKNTLIILDLGLSYEELLKNDITLGARVTFKSNFKKLSEDRYLSKAVDDRLGCSVLVDLVKYYLTSDVDDNLCFYFTVQEEVGTRGAMVLPNVLPIDYFIAIDCSPISDYLNNSSAALGEGFLVRMYDPHNILDYDYMNFLTNLAKESNIKHQVYISAGGTDAAKVALSGKGVVSTTFGIPARYIHSNASIFDIKDVKSVIDFSITYVNNLKNYR